MTTQPLCILGENVVEDYKYLVVHLDNRLNCGPALTLYKRRVWANSISKGGWDLSAHAARCWRDSLSLLLPVHCCLLRCAGGASSALVPLTAWMNRSRRSALQLDIFEEIVDAEQTAFHYVNLVHLLYHIMDGLLLQTDPTALWQGHFRKSFLPKAITFTNILYNIYGFAQYLLCWFNLFCYFIVFMFICSVYICTIFVVYLWFIFSHAF